MKSVNNSVFVYVNQQLKVESKFGTQPGDMWKFRSSEWI